MKAFILDRYGKTERLRAAEVPKPQLRDDDVLIEVHAAAVNLIDVKIRNGEFKLILPYKTPIIRCGGCGGERRVDSAVLQSRG